MPRIGSSPRPPSARSAQETLTSTDLALRIAKPLSDAEKKNVAASAERSLVAQLQKAQGMRQPDILAVYAEEAGKLLLIRRSLEKTRTDPPAVQRLASQVEALLNQVVDLRVTKMRTLAASPGGPDAIREAESEAIALRADLARLTWVGFPARRVDVDALDLAVKTAVVNGFR